MHVCVGILWWMLPQIFETNHRAILDGTQQQPVDPVVNWSHVNMEHDVQPQKNAGILSHFQTKCGQASIPHCLTYAHSAWWFKWCLLSVYSWDDSPNKKMRWVDSRISLEGMNFADIEGLSVGLTITFTLGETQLCVSCHQADGVPHMIPNLD